MHNSDPVTDLATIENCSELTAEHAKQAASSAAEIRALLERFVQIAKPGDGCPKVLMALARLVGQEWLEGDLRVELSGDDASTTLVLLCDYGVGIRERLLPAFRFEVPFDEFERALQLAPKLVLPLRVTDDGATLVLTPLHTSEARVRSLALPQIDVDSTCLGDDERTTAPPPSDELLVVDVATPEELALLAASADDVPNVDDAPTAPPPAANAADPAADAADLEHAGRMQSGAVRSGSDPVPPSAKRGANVHTCPTVRRMVAIDAPAIAGASRRDPRREDD